MEAHENGIRKLEIVTIMSVPPLKVTEPRQVRKVLVSEELLEQRRTRSIEGCYQVVLYYENLKKKKEKDEKQKGWYLAGWIVESLAKVLLDHPLLAGRLHSKDHSGFEIVSNDSGIRLLEARYRSTLSEFLALQEKDLLEPQLVFWKDIDPHFPHFSPLFYVQVTDFECGGYSIGISCSLLLAEVMVVGNFLKKWAEIHNDMSFEKEIAETPIFYHPRLENEESLPDDVTTRSESKGGVESAVFKVVAAKDVKSGKEVWREVVGRVCVEEGEEFCLAVREEEWWEVTKVERCSEKGKEMMRRCTWKEFGEYDVAFDGGKKPVLVSCRVGCVGDVRVMVVPHSTHACAAVIVASPSFTHI